MAVGHIVKLMFLCAIMLYITMLAVELEGLLIGLEEHMNANRSNQRKVTDSCLSFVGFFFILLFASRLADIMEDHQTQH